MFIYLRNLRIHIKQFQNCYQKKNPQLLQKTKPSLIFTYSSFFLQSESIQPKNIYSKVPQVWLILCLTYIHMFFHVVIHLKPRLIYLYSIFRLFLFFWVYEFCLIYESLTWLQKTELYKEEYSREISLSVFYSQFQPHSQTLPVSNSNLINFWFIRPGLLFGQKSHLCIFSLPFFSYTKGSILQILLYSSLFITGLYILEIIPCQFIDVIFSLPYRYIALNYVFVPIV